MTKPKPKPLTPQQLLEQARNDLRARESVLTSEIEQLTTRLETLLQDRLQTRHALANTERALEPAAERAPKLVDEPEETESPEVLSDEQYEAMADDVFGPEPDRRRWDAEEDDPVFGGGP